MKISLVVLTFNRAETVARAMRHNLANAGYPIHELIWVDNGSTDNVREVMLDFMPDVSILNNENLGVAKGYNRGFAMATGDWIALTGCDMLMPENWLRKWVEHIEAIPNTGVASIYSQPIDKVPERIRGDRLQFGDLSVIPALPFGRRIMSRAVLKRVGYLREDFGLYGWEDVEWGERCYRMCQEDGLLTYALPDVAEHLGTEGVKMYDGNDPQEYHEFKRLEVIDPKKQEKMAECRAAGYPYYNPYA